MEKKIQEWIEKVIKKYEIPNMEKVSAIKRDRILLDDGWPTPACWKENHGKPELLVGPCAGNYYEISPEKITSIPCDAKSLKEREIIIFSEELKKEVEDIILLGNDIVTGHKAFINYDPNS